MNKYKKHLVSAWLVWVIALLLPWAAVQGQEGQQIEITSIDTSDYPRVQAFVAAPDGDLPDPDMVTIYEDDQMLEEASIETRRVGVAVVVLIDLSRSMRGRGMPDSLDRLQDAREQTIRIARALDPNTDMLSIFTFNRIPKQWQALTWVDGGAIENMFNTTPELQVIPDKPGGRNTPPSPEDYRNDDYAYSALSRAVNAALDELTNPSTNDPELQMRLLRMQKVIVLIGDSCDDDLETMNSSTCTIPVDVETRLQDVIRDGSVSIFSVGVGVDDRQLSAPSPDRAEAGFAYNAQFQLLETYARRVPQGGFMHLYTSNREQVPSVLEEFETTIIAPLVQRGKQMVVRYDSQVRGGEHRLSIDSGAVPIAATFHEPRIPPAAHLQVSTEQGRVIVRTEAINSQSPIAQIAYFINDEPEPMVTLSPPFELDATLLEPATYTITAQITDQRGVQSERSAPLQIDVLPPSPTLDGTAALDWQNHPIASLDQVLRQNIISLVSLFVVIIISIIALATPRGRTMVSETQSQVTGVLARMTRPFQADEAQDIFQSPNYVLIVRAGSDVGQQYPLMDRNTYIGANPGWVDIVLNDPHISGRHLSITYDGSDLYITDMNSTNGTFVNGIRLQPYARTSLQPGSIIMIGGMTLELVWQEATESPDRTARTIKYEPHEQPPGADQSSAL